jgi:hypothetical protein
VASGAPLLSGSRAPVPADAPKAAAARKEPENPIATPRAWKYGLSLRNNVFKPGQGEGVSVELTLDKPGRVEAAVLKAGGGLVKALYSGDMPGGPSVYSWDGTDASGRPAPSGFYWLVLKSPGKTEKLKVVLAR